MIYLMDYSFYSSVTHKPQHVSKALTLPGLEVGFPLWLHGWSKTLTLPGWRGFRSQKKRRPLPNGTLEQSLRQTAHINLLFCVNQLIHTNTETFFFSPVGLFSRSFRSLLVVTQATSVHCRRWWLLFVSRWPDVCDQRRSPKQSGCCLLVCCCAG